MWEFDWRFWVAILGATAVRVLTSENHSWTRSGITVFTAVFVAWQFTDPVLTWFNLPFTVWRNPVAALIALTGEGIARFIINMANNPSAVIDLYNKWRGK